MGRQSCDRLVARDGGLLLYDHVERLVVEDNRRLDDALPVRRKGQTVERAGCSLPVDEEQKFEEDERSGAKRSMREAATIVIGSVRRTGLHLSNIVGCIEFCERNSAFVAWSKLLASGATMQTTEHGWPEFNSVRTLPSLPESSGRQVTRCA
jgi:hypothetical protein